MSSNFHTSNGVSPKPCVKKKNISCLYAVRASF